MTEPMEGLTLAVTSSTGVMSLALGRLARVSPAGPDEDTAGTAAEDTAGAADEDTAEVIAEVTVATERRHAEEITPQLASLVADAGLTLGHIDRFVVDVGPGRFTGLRVGLATVRALAFALGRPVVPLTSLAVLAASADQPPGTTVTAVIDARRSEVFQQSFVDGAPVGQPLVVGPDEGASMADGVVVGDGLDRYLDVYQSAAADTGARPIPGVELRAGVMVAMSAGRDASPGSEIIPLYLRDPDAVPNIKTRAPA